MATLNHEYPVAVEWTGGRDGQGEVVAGHSGERIPVRVPEEFNGPGGATNPEELLTSAIASCYSITFGIISANRKIPVTGLHVDATGHVEQQGANFTFKQITIRPRITLDAAATPEQEAMAGELAHKADNYCIITNAVRGKVEVVVEPTIERAS